MRLYYQRQRKKLIDCIEKSSLKDKCTIIENDSGLHFLIRLDTDLPDEEVENRLKKSGIQIRALSEYYFTDHAGKEHYFIMNYSHIDISRMPEACEAIYNSLSTN